MGFGNLGKKENIADKKDVIRTSSFGALESGVHAGEIEVAYLSKSKGGAASLTVHVKMDSGAVFKNTMWLTGGDKKGNNNFFVDKDGNEQYLPGFVTADHICLLAAGDDIGTLAEDTVSRGIKVYDYDAGKEITKEFEVIEELDGTRIKLGVLKQVVDKTKLEGNAYVPTGETREQNEIVYVFSDDDGRTVMECIAEEDEGSFINDWTEAYTGKTINKAKGAKGSTAGTPSGAGDTSASSESGKKKAGGIFGKKS